MRTGCDECGANWDNVCDCGNRMCWKHTHFYIDGNNVAITRNSKPMCGWCWHDQSRGVLDAHNLLLSGDWATLHYESREYFTVRLTAQGSVVS